MASRIWSENGARRGSAEWNSGRHLHPIEKLHVRVLGHLQSVLDHFKNPTYTLGQYNNSHIGRIIENSYTKTWHMDHVSVKRPNCPDCLWNNALTHTDIQNNNVNLTSHTFVAVFSFKTILANTAVAFSCEAHLTDEVPSKAWITVTKVLFGSILF